VVNGYFEFIGENLLRSFPAGDACDYIIKSFTFYPV
jgi:hypothetical protein